MLFSYKQISDRGNYALCGIILNKGKYTKIRTWLRKVIKKVNTIQMKLLNLNDCEIRLRFTP